MVCFSLNNSGEVEHGDAVEIAVSGHQPTEAANSVLFDAQASTTKDKVNKTKENKTKKTSTKRD